MTIIFDIETFIKSRNNYNLVQNIPKNIIQTKNNKRFHQKIYDNIQNTLFLNPDYNYYLITDEIGEELIKNNFESHILKAYYKLNIDQIKRNFLKYIALYLYGGVYINLDNGINGELNNIINNNFHHYFFWDNEKNIKNDVIISKSGNKIIFDIIHEMVNRINNFENNIHLATGNLLLTDIIYKDLTGEDEYYNINSKFSQKDRENLWKNNQNYKDGRLEYQSNVFNFTIHFKKEYLYDENIPEYTSNTILYKHIHIGSSETNTKIVKLEKIYSKDTKLTFKHQYKDEFSYEFDNETIKITRLDESKGWGQNLIAYLCS